MSCQVANLPATDAPDPALHCTLCSWLDRRRAEEDEADWEWKRTDELIHPQVTRAPTLCTVLNSGIYRTSDV